MNYFEHHIGDYDQATAHLSAVEDGIYSRLIRRYMASEKPLPADIPALQRLVRAHTRDEKKAVQTVLSEFFELRDGCYHQKRCDEEIERYNDKAPDRDAKRENERERQRRARERRKLIFDLLREVGEIPAFDAPMSHLSALLAKHKITPGSHATQRDVTPPVTRDVTATHTPDTTTHTPDPNTHTESSPPVSPEPTMPRAPTLAAQVCRAMKARGISDVNPGHLDLLALIAAGATLDEFDGAAAEAVAKRKGFAYAIGTVKRRRQEAATAPPLHQGAMPQQAQSRKDVQLQTAALMTGAAPMPRNPQPEPETIDVESRILPP